MKRSLPIEKKIDPYQRLIDLIRDRQRKEKELSKPPYTTHPTDENFKDVNGYALLHYAVLSGDVDKVKACLKNNADVNLIFSDFNQISSESKQTSLQMALENGHLEIAKLLFDAGADVSSI